MCTVKLRAMYYPGVELTETTTRFGMKETSPSSLYQTHIAGKVIYEFDLLQYLSKYFGENMVRDRVQLYTLLSGNVPDKEYCRILAYCYRRYSAFANFIDYEYYFGNQDAKLFKRIVTKLQLLVTEARLYVSGFGGRVLMEDRGYVYVAFNEGSSPNFDIEGVTSIYV